ncbi:xyloglucan galactosyltransferase xlt2 [Quercus suber]|uniref:Xyloglucan galactosyltransferase xlt2 n=1 Tax=Quercus suber TaxID=58331 RepID=A0AAW0KFT9_QUESU
MGRWRWVGEDEDEGWVSEDEGWVGGGRGQGMGRWSGLHMTIGSRVEGCLDPWSPRYCDAVLNGGFGRKAATQLAEVVPESLAPAWYWTDQFMLEVIFHNRVLKHACRTLEPESATAFYIPFYAGLAVGRYLFTNHDNKARDSDCEMLLRWVQEQPFWKRSSGSDHFITLGRMVWDFRRSGENDWGSSFVYMEGMRNIQRLVIERSPWDPLDAGVPYPTGFHPRSDADVLEWQDYVSTHKRTSQFCFAGGTRGAFKNDFRGYLLSYCKNESDSCRVVDCSGTRCYNGASAILDMFLGSDFCLQPRGDTYTRRSVFDCIVAGSIPVFFWERTAYDQYEWFLPGEPTSYSVFIDNKAVKNGSVSIRNVLEKYSREEVSKMRERVINIIPQILYATPQEGLETIKDAFDVAIEGVLTRIKKQ